MRLEHLLSGAGMLFFSVFHVGELWRNAVQCGLCRCGSRLFFPASCLLYYGGLAQLARALAWHARGHRFDPDILHPPPFVEESFFDMLRQRRHKIRISVTLLSVPCMPCGFPARRMVDGRWCLLSYARREQGRTVDALAHGGDEGRDKLR